MTIELETVIAAGTAIITTTIAIYKWTKARIATAELNRLVNTARDATNQASDGGSSVTTSEALDMIGQTIDSLSTIEK